MKKELSIIALALITSFNISANEDKESKESKLYSEIVSDIKEEEPSLSKSSLYREAVNENRENSENKSKYRNLKKLSELKNEYYNSKINELKSEIEIKQLQFINELPVEKTFDDDKYLFEETKSESLSNKKEHPPVKDSSLRYSEFDKETYEIDQLIIKEEKEKPLVNNNNTIGVDTGNLKIQESVFNDFENISDVNDNLVIDDTLIDLVEDNELVKNDIKVKEQDESNISAEISDEDLAILGMNRDEYEKMLAQHGGDKNEEIKAVEKAPVENKIKENNEEVAKNKNFQPIIFSKITDVKVKKIIIFDKTRIADLNMNVYIGDGVNGNEEKVKAKSIKEGHIIRVGDFKFKINAITNTEIEIENMNDNKVITVSSL